MALLAVTLTSFSSKSCDEVLPSMGRVLNSVIVPSLISSGSFVLSIYLLSSSSKMSLLLGFINCSTEALLFVAFKPNPPV